MIKEEFDDLMQLSLQAGTLKRPIAFERYIDDRFVNAATPTRIAL
jgi:NitT/TauT family transport system substrate-binding protein